MSKDKAALVALAERVEQLTGPSREVDREIAVTLGAPPLYKVRGSITSTWADFTASLDAAMTLASEDDTPDLLIEAIDRLRETNPTADRYFEKVARFFVAAALRARAEQSA